MIAVKILNNMRKFENKSNISIMIKIHYTKRNLTHITLNNHTTNKKKRENEAKDR